MVGNATGSMQDDGLSVPCNAKCFNRSENGFGCAASFDGSNIAHLHAVRKEHIGDESVTKTRERTTRGQTGFVKVYGQERGRRERLVARLRTCVFYDGSRFRFHFAMPGIFGQPQNVCESFYTAVLGTKCGDRMYRNVMVQVKQEAMTQTNALVSSYTSVLVSCDMAGTAAQLRGRRGRNTVFWLARFIKMYAMPLPMRKEIRFDFANRAGLYEFLRQDLAMQLQMGVECCTTSHLVKIKRFLEMIRPPYHPLVADAIAEKVGTVVQDDGFKNWKLNFLDPSKLRDFSVCSTCALNATLRRQATANGNKPAFDYAMRTMDVHQKVVQARRHHFVWTQREASENPTQRVAMICDAMEHSKLDGPILPRCLRWSKMKSETVMPAHLVGVLTWGHGRPKTWAYFNDQLVGGNGAGIGNTCEVILQTLSKLALAGQLPTDRNTRIFSLQADNCADNKNWATLILLALLVRTGTFTRVEFNFLHVGHTHEVIDQIFAVTSDYLRSTDDDVTTLPKLQDRIKSKLNAHHVSDITGYRDFDLALTTFASGSMSGHSKAFMFALELADDGYGVKLMYQTDEALDGPWYEVDGLLDADEAGVGFTGEFSCEAHPLLDYDDCSGFVTDLNDGVRTDKFLNRITKLATESITTNNAEGEKEEMHVLTPASAEYWREVVRKATDQAELAGRLAQVPTTINLNLVKESDWTTSAAAPPNMAEGLLEGQQSGVFRSRQLRSITISNTLETVGRINGRNREDMVKENLIRRWIHHEHNTLQPDAYPVEGEIIVWIYRHNDDLLNDFATWNLFFGKVLQVCKIGDAGPWKQQVGQAGPEASELDAPTADDAGTMNACQVLVMSFTMTENRDIAYQDQVRPTTSVFVKAQVAPIIHRPNNSRDKRPEAARVETLWIPLQDIIASTAILGEPITQSSESRRAIEPFRTSGRGTLRSGLVAACDHHACANSAARPRCDHCNAVYDRYTADEGLGLGHAEDEDKDEDRE